MQAPGDKQFVLWDQSCWTPGKQLGDFLGVQTQVQQHILSVGTAVMDCEPQGKLLQWCCPTCAHVTESVCTHVGPLWTEFVSQTIWDSSLALKGTSYMQSTKENSPVWYNCVWTAVEYHNGCPQQDSINILWYALASAADPVYLAKPSGALSVLDSHYATFTCRDNPSLVGHFSNLVRNHYCKCSECHFQGLWGWAN